MEVDGVVVDVTAAQFPGHSSALTCKKPNPFERIFQDVERLSPDLDIGRFRAISMRNQEAVLSELSHRIMAEQVVPADENLLRASDARAQAQTESARAAVAAFRALGGGWQPRESEAVAIK